MERAHGGWSGRTADGAGARRMERAGMADGAGGHGGWSGRTADGAGAWRAGMAGGCPGRRPLTA